MEPDRIWDLLNAHRNYGIIIRHCQSCRTTDDAEARSFSAIVEHQGPYPATVITCLVP